MPLGYFRVTALPTLAGSESRATQDLPYARRRRLRKMRLRTESINSALSGFGDVLQKIYVCLGNTFAETDLGLPTEGV
jgi:hypothetical protein